MGGGGPAVISLGGPGSHRTRAGPAAQRGAGHLPATGRQGDGGGAPDAPAPALRGPRVPRQWADLHGDHAPFLYRPPQVRTLL